MPIPISWYPVDNSTDLQKGRAYQTLPFARYHNFRSFGDKLVKQGFKQFHRGDTPIQLTPNTNIVCDPNQPYMIGSEIALSFGLGKMGRPSVLRYGYFELKKLYCVDEIAKEFQLYNNCLYFTLFEDAGLGYLFQWIMQQENPACYKKPGDVPNFSSLMQYAMLMFRYTGSLNMWKAVGPKTKVMDEANLADRRIELRL